MPEPVHRLTEKLAIFGHFDGLRLAPISSTPNFSKTPMIGSAKRRVQAGLPAHCWQQRIGAFLFDDLGDDFGRDRLDIGRIRHLRVGHDGRGVRVDQDDPVALFRSALQACAPE